MTILIATVGSIYAVSLCFVAVLLTRAMWHDRSTPLASSVEPVLATAPPVPLPELQPATKSA